MQDDNIVFNTREEDLRADHLAGLNSQYNLSVREAGVLIFGFQWESWYLPFILRVTSSPPVETG